MKFKLFWLILLNLILVFISLHLSDLGVSLDLWSFPLNETEKFIFELRWQRTLSCLLVGGSLAICGFLFQNLLKNPLAETFTMGFSGASALGINAAILLGLSTQIYGPAFFGFLFCIALAFLIHWIQKSLGIGSSHSLLLLGISIGFFCNALSLLLQSLLKPDELQYSFYWMIGSFESLRNSWWPSLLLLQVPLYLFYRNQKKEIDLLLIHPETARGLGLNSQKIESTIFFLGALVCGISVSISGIIAFVGLMAPHLSKSYMKAASIQNNYWPCFWIGSSLVLGADILARLLSQNSFIPTGGIIALMGAPFLALLLLKPKKQRATQSLEV